MKDPAVEIDPKLRGAAYFAVRRETYGKSTFGINSGVPRRSNWSGFETAADDLPASSAPPPLTRLGHRPEFHVAVAKPVSALCPGEPA
jgi:hypothetical protein